MMALMMLNLLGKFCWDIEDVQTLAILKAGRGRVESLLNNFNLSFH